MRMGLFMALAIAMHNFPEGLATFAAGMVDPTIAVPIAVAIAIHNIPIQRVKRLSPSGNFLMSLILREFRIFISNFSHVIAIATKQVEPRYPTANQERGTKGNPNILALLTLLFLYAW